MKSSVCSSWDQWHTLATPKFDGIRVQPTSGGERPQAVAGLSNTARRPQAQRDGHTVPTSSFSTMRNAASAF